MDLRVQGSLEIVAVGNGGRAHPISEGVNTGKEVLKTGDLEEDPSKEFKVPLPQVKLAVDGLNGAMEFINRGLKFTLHEGSDRIMVEVIDLATQEVIKEIPPQKLLDTVARIREMIGLLLDEWA